MKLYPENEIILLLRKAAAIKPDNLVPLCDKRLRYYGRNKGYMQCIKCYPGKSVGLKERPKCEKNYAHLCCYEPED